MSEALRLADAMTHYFDERGPDAEEVAAELRRLHRVEEAYNLWHEKTEWVQDTAQPRELGKHRADILRQRIDRLHAENEALREANDSFATASILPDDKMIVSRADYAELVEALQRFSNMYGHLWDSADTKGAGWLSPDSVKAYDDLHELVGDLLAKYEVSNGS